MKNLLKKWNESSLVLRILGGLIIGVVLGLAVPQAAPIGLLGDLFVGALKAVAPPPGGTEDQHVPGHSPLSAGHLY